MDYSLVERNLLVIIWQKFLLVGDFCLTGEASVKCLREYFLSILWKSHRSDRQVALCETSRGIEENNLSVGWNIPTQGGGHTCPG